MAKFFYTPKPRQFDYRPRFYDPEKEARDKRREELLGKRASGDEEYTPGDLLRSRQMQRMIAKDNDRSKRKKRGSMLMLIVVLLALAVAVMWVIS